MEVISTRSLIRTVAARWRRQYVGVATDHPRSVTGDRLAALDPETATPAEVVAIIGNDSWTSVDCNECGRQVDVAVEVGEERDYESQTAVVCRDCLTKALALLDSNP